MGVVEGVRGHERERENLTTFCLSSVHLGGKAWDFLFLWNWERDGK